MNHIYRVFDFVLVESEMRDGNQGPGCQPYQKSQAFLRQEIHKRHKNAEIIELGGKFR